jgi:hypothetical protein
MVGGAGDAGGAAANDDDDVGGGGDGASPAPAIKPGGPIHAVKLF